ncbi:MAG: DUF1460 domain-containing protein [Bacteroides sp.]|nr:DUF1460 domain-containing protein [Bacteroides sp.]
MKRIILLGIILVNTFLAYAHEQDSIKVENWLKEAISLPQDSCRTLHFAKQMLGVPYVAATLDGNEEEQLVVHVDQLDCTTFVETVLALCIADKRDARSFDGFKKALSDVRYRDGVLDGYASRLHYFSDWIRNNEQMGFVKECTSETSCAQPQELWLNFMTAHVDSYQPMKKNPALVEVMAAQEKHWQGTIVSYIPKEKLNLPPEELKIKDGDILAMVTNIKGLDIVHVGFAFWKDNHLHLLHASSSAKKVIEDPKTQYESSGKTKAHIGLRAIRVVY